MCIPEPVWSPGHFSTSAATNHGVPLRSMMRQSLMLPSKYGCAVRLPKSLSDNRFIHLLTDLAHDLLICLGHGKAKGVGVR